MTTYAESLKKKAELLRSIESHVVAETGGGVAPDLGYSLKGTHEVFDKIVLEGLLLQNGMPRFEGRLTQDQVRSIHSYIIDKTNKKIEELGS